MTDSVVIPFDAHASRASLYRKLLLRSTRKVSSDAPIPRLMIEHTVTPSSDQVAQYCKVCRIEASSDYLPLLFPYSLMGDLQLQLLGHREFPLRSMGMLHLRNHITRYAMIATGLELKLMCRIGAQRVTEKGLEFDILSEVRQGERVTWNCLSTALKPGRFGTPDPPSHLADLFPKQSAGELWDEFDAPKDIGRQYARVSGDYNPIHVSALAAKLFGFRTSIAHGMWSLAAGLARVTELEPVCQLDAAFKGPVFTGSHLRVFRVEDRFDFFCDDNPRPVTCARLRVDEIDTADA